MFFTPRLTLLSSIKININTFKHIPTSNALSYNKALGFAFILKLRHPGFPSFWNKNKNDFQFFMTKWLMLIASKVTELSDRQKTNMKDHLKGSVFFSF